MTYRVGFEPTQTYVYLLSRQALWTSQASIRFFNKPKKLWVGHYTLLKNDIFSKNILPATGSPTATLLRLRFSRQRHLDQYIIHSHEIKKLSPISHYIHDTSLAIARAPTA